MDIELQYFDGCPNWRTAADRLREALDTTETTASVTYVQVETDEEAERLDFHGSPTFLIEGRDPFAAPGLTTGLACRIYRTPAGLAGAPTTEQLIKVLNEHRQL